jgi:hypothetical protein
MGSGVELQGKFHSLRGFALGVRHVAQMSRWAFCETLITVGQWKGFSWRYYSKNSSPESEEPELKLELHVGGTFISIF